MEKVGRIAKNTVIFLLFFICGLFIFRCCFAADRSTLNDIIPTDGLRAAYAADGELEILSHEVVREISEDGYMAAYAFVWIPEAGEVQLTVRYNDSVYEYNGLPAGDTFTFVLTDSKSGKVYEAAVLAEEKKWMYNFRRLSFSGVEITEGNDLVLCMLCGGEEISQDTVHYADQNAVLRPYKLSRSEKKVLEQP